MMLIAKNMKPDKKCRLYLALAVLETTGLVCFSFLPFIGFVRTGLRLGDLEHFIAYAVYGFLVNRTHSCLAPDSKRKILIAAVAGSLVGGLCETIQFFLPYRTADITDWFIDTTGSFAGAALSLSFKDRF
jgi:glycopeptide antibiotics resistance protein